MDSEEWIIRTVLNTPESTQHAIENTLCTPPRGLWAPCLGCIGTAESKFFALQLDHAAGLGAQAGASGGEAPHSGRRRRGEEVSLEHPLPRVHQDQPRAGLGHVRGDATVVHGWFRVKRLRGRSVFVSLTMEVESASGIFF